MSGDLKDNKALPSNSLEVSKPQHEDVQRTVPVKAAPAKQANKPAEKLASASMDKNTVRYSDCPNPTSCIKKSITISHGTHGSHRRTMWGRTSVSRPFHN